MLFSPQAPDAVGFHFFRIARRLLRYPDKAAYLASIARKACPFEVQNTLGIPR
jgi:hypothetical protein